MTTAAVAALPEVTYHLAARLQHLASDSLYTFTPGTRDLDVPDLDATECTVTASFTHDRDVVAATLWARSTATHTLVAAAKAHAQISTANPVGAISTRILHFRSGPLLWTATPTGTPLAYTALGAYPYRLEPVHRLGHEPDWIVTAAGLRADAHRPRFAGIVGACLYIATDIEPPLPTAPRRARRRR